MGKSISDRVDEFVEVCKYCNRTPEENLECILNDNPEEREDAGLMEEWELIVNLARVQLNS